MKKPEILAPAGNMECLRSAIAAGCDAVYLGGKLFGARAFSGNFSDDEIIEAVKLCHLYGVKLYVTVNTIIYEAEIKSFMKYIDFLYMNNVDAVIVQDIGMMDLIRQTYPDFDVHASTQMHIHSLEGVKLVEKIGLTRAVLARETTIEDIENIKKNTKIELEIFVHGALCVCYSGQCLMSSLIGGRSGNRGVCAQPCRQKYNVLNSKKQKVNTESFNISPKDLNSLDNLNYLLDIGVDSLKIEGRMKSSSYVYLVVSLYRQAVDSYFEKGIIEINEDYLKKLKVTFNRLYTKGFMFHENNDDFINPKRSNHQGIQIGKVIKVNKDKIDIKLNDNLSINDGIRISSKEDIGFIVTQMFINNKRVDNGKKGDIISIKNPGNIDINSIVLKTLDYNLNKEIESYTKKIDRKVSISGNLVIKENEKILLEVSDGFNNISLLSDNVISKAINNPTSMEKVESQMKKTGSSVYEFNELTTNYNELLFVPIKELNDLRRNALLKLDEARLNINREYIKKVYERKIPTFERKKEFSMYTISSEVLNKININKYNYIYLNEDLFNIYNNKYNNIYLKLPRVKTSFSEIKGHILVGELGSVNKYKDIDTDFSLNVVNSYSVALLHSLGVNKITLSLELNNTQIEKLINDYVLRYNAKPNLEYVIYGREEMMISKFNVLKYYDLTNNGYLQDKYNNLYPVKEMDNLMYIYNNKIRNIKDIDYLYELGINSFRYNIINDEDLNYI